MASLLDRVFDYAFYGYIFVTVFFLSGSIYGVNFFLPMCLLLLPLAVYSLFRRNRSSLFSFSLTLLIPMILSLWIVIALCNEFELDGVKGHFSEVLFTFFTCWLIYVFSGGDQVQQRRFLRLVIASVIASALLKIGIFFYAVTHGIPIVEIVLLLDKIFGTDIMTMDLGALFGRLQFAADALIPVCIFIILRHRATLGYGSFRAAVSILLLFASVLFSFSRYYWAFAAVAFVLGLLLGKRDRFQVVLAAVIGVSILISLPALFALYQLRFSAVVAGSSDTERAAQIPALEDFFWDSPILGHGFGSYTTQLLRASGAGRHNYELQLLALLGQVGLVGIVGFLVLLLWYFERLWWKSPLAWSDRMAIAILLLAWIAGGFSNPLLFNPLAGIIYAALSTLTGLETTSKPRGLDALGPPSRWKGLPSFLGIRAHSSRSPGPIHG